LGSEDPGKVVRGVLVPLGKLLGWNQQKDWASGEIVEIVGRIRH
jgi:hypothetical protein